MIVFSIVLFTIYYTMTSSIYIIVYTVKKAMIYDMKEGGGGLAAGWRRVGGGEMGLLAVSTATSTGAGTGGLGAHP
jgi:hypothetical protein